MSLRQYSARNKHSLKIAYTKEAICYSEVPFNINDLIKQRIRWTVGLSDVLLKYKSMAISTKYNLKERLSFWYYILFEKFSPHIEFLSLVICLCLKVYKFTYAFLVTIVFQFVFSIYASFESIKRAFKETTNKVKVFFRIIFLLLTFVSIYHIIHSFVRLIVVLYFQLTKHKSKKNNSSWDHPKRMKKIVIKQHISFSNINIQKVY